MMGVTVTGLNVVVTSFEGSPARLAANLRKAVQVTCSKVKSDARQRISGRRYLPRYPYSITYDVRVRPEGVEGEVGPDKSLPQGPLGNIIEYGTSKNAPIPHLGPALDAHEGDLLTGVEIAVRQAL
jgi:hypothetical protein